MSNAVLLAQYNQVVAVDLVPEKVAMVNAKISPIEDAEISDYLANKTLKLVAITEPKEAYEGADFVIIATPTDYDPETKEPLNNGSI